MLRKSIKKSENEEENIFWVTMTDLLLGLTMVFMTLFVLAMTGFTQNKLQQQQTQSDVAKELIKNMQAQKINAQIDSSGQVKISDVELFDVNSYTLSDNGKKYLDKFMPVYINTIFSNPKLADKIINISIQGHTDSQMFKNVSSKEEQFTKNMDLSLRRANAVEDYLFKTTYDKKYTDKLTQVLEVEGKSYTEPVLVNGKEDYNKSRRVELKLTAKDSNLQDFLLKGTSKKIILTK
jgi:chemotaxis protein MotB